MTATQFAFVLICVASGTALAAPPEPAGFRLDRYRAPVPDTLHGAAVIHSAALTHLIETQHPVLIDVLPSPQPPADARAGMVRMPVPHSDLPGSIWLPDIGRGALPAALDATFRARLIVLSHHLKSAPMVFYCLSSCWMSWNAAKRAVGYGYTGVIWYPDGADGWQASGGLVSVNMPAR